MVYVQSSSEIGGASSLPRQSTGSVSGLASSRAREAGSGHCGESCEPRTKRPSTSKSSEFGVAQRRVAPTKLRVATWNLGTMKGRSAEVIETLSRRRVDICGVQEHRWRGGLKTNQVRYLKGKNSEYKFFFCANDSGLGGVGILLAENWADKVIEVQRPCDRIILLKLIIGKAVTTFISVYAPQTNLNIVEKDRFYDQLQSTIATVPASEIVIPVGDWNGHVGAAAGVYSEAHGGHGFGTLNADGERILEFAVANGLRVGNTWYKKRDSHLITYSSGGHSTQIDYILYPKRFSSAVSNVKVIPNEECVQQHHLVVCDFTVLVPPLKKRRFSPRIRAWKLKDSTSASLFQEIFKKKVMTAAATANTTSLIML